MQIPQTDEEIHVYVWNIIMQLMQLLFTYLKQINVVQISFALVEITRVINIKF